MFVGKSALLGPRSTRIRSFRCLKWSEVSQGATLKQCLVHFDDAFHFVHPWLQSTKKKDDAIRFCFSECRKLWNTSRRLSLKLDTVSKICGCGLIGSIWRVNCLMFSSFCWLAPNYTSHRSCLGPLHIFLVGRKVVPHFGISARKCFIFASSKHLSYSWL